MDPIPQQFPGQRALLAVVVISVLMAACAGRPPSRPADPGIDPTAGPTTGPAATEPVSPPVQHPDPAPAHDKTGQASQVAGAAPRVPSGAVTGPAPEVAVRELSRHHGKAAAPAGAISALPCCRPSWSPPGSPPATDREQYAANPANPVHLTATEPVSTFGVDVDTAAYANVRRFLEDGQLPPRDAVRVEELINYFPYDYPRPAAGDQPFAVTTTVAPAPWNRERLLLQVGLQARAVSAGQRRPANLVLLVDVSGSMQDPDKLPLLKRSLGLLVRQLDGRDRLSLVVYAGAAGAVLEPTPGDAHHRILAAIERLEAGGSTNGGDGIRLAYRLAREGYRRDGINRVILATDGDFNVGTVDFAALLDVVARERTGGVALTTLGFGAGNLNDRLLEQLADTGNGNYAYIDSLNEGRKVLVEQLTGTLQTIARDVKIQVEFNPATVAEYRLIGYENRLLRREDFNNDRVDSGEIGAGHSVTALYELTPVGSQSQQVDPLRYAPAPQPADTGKPGELALVRLRYQAPQGGTSRLLEQVVRAGEPASAIATRELRFAAAVAGFGQWLRGGEYTGGFGADQILALASSARGNDPLGHRGEFLQLVRLAAALAPAGPEASPEPALQPAATDGVAYPSTLRTSDALAHTP